MVVIRDPLPRLVEKFGKEIVDLIYHYSEIVGYSVDQEDDLKIEFNPDRPDLFSFPTLVKQIKTYYYGEIEIRRSQSKDENIKVDVSQGSRSIRPYFSAFTADGSSIGSYFDDLIDYQKTLHSTIGKNRLKVAIGIHDAEKTGTMIHYRTVSRSVRMETYDGFSGTVDEVLRNHEKGKMYGSLLPDTGRVVAITDEDGEILSLPPVINSYRSRIDQNTKKFFVDITGTDLNSVKHAHYLLSNFFSSLKYRVRMPTINGIPAFEKSSIATFDYRPIRPRRKNIDRYLGEFLEDEEIIVLLRKMGYVAEPGSPEIVVYVPGYRVDVMGEMDVIEDIIKAKGIENIKEKEIYIGKFGRPIYKNDMKNMIRDVMIGLGFQEVMTFVLTSSVYADGYTGGVKLLNPKSDDYSVIRDKIYPNLIDLIARNKKHPLPQKIFEIGEKMVDGKQISALSCVIADTRSEFSVAKSYLQAFLSRFMKGDIAIEESNIYGAIEGRSGYIKICNKYIGMIGEIHPEILDRFSLAVPVSFFEVNLDHILSIGR